MACRINMYVLTEKYVRKRPNVAQRKAPAPRAAKQRENLNYIPVTKN